MSMGQFEQLYREKLTTPENIAARLKNGDIVRSDIGASVPTALFHAICAYVKAHDVHDLAMELSKEMAPFGCYTGLMV